MDQSYEPRQLLLDKKKKKKRESYSIEVVCVWIPNKHFDCWSETHVNSTESM